MRGERIGTIPTRGAGCVLLGLLAVLGACTRPRPALPAPLDSGDLVRRHYDQVCRVDPGERPAVRASEIFDTAGLSADLARVETQPLPPGPGSVATRWHTLDFISRYDSDGRPRAMGVWETTLDSVAALQVDGILRSRVRSLAGLLEPEGFRTIVVFSARPNVEIGTAVVCLPHVMHERDTRPPGLPAEVATWLESSNFRPRAGGLGGREVATLRIHLNKEGVVTALDSLSGASVAMAASREIIAQLRFDPALRNGEPILGEIAQSFGFRAGYLTGR